MRKFIAVFSLIFCTQIHADNFSEALKRHAQTHTRNLFQDMVTLRGTGLPWRTILESNLPKVIDTECGYKKQVGLPDASFSVVQPDVAKIAGQRIADSYAQMFSRKSTTIDLASVRHMSGKPGDQVIVTLRAIPAQKADNKISFLLELDPYGQMVLCDVIIGENPDNGVLLSIGRELGR